jgi:inner membrane protein YidH
LAEPAKDDGSPREAAPPTTRIEPDVRFSLANERTLLAYQRTAIGLVAGAIAVSHFFDDAVSVVLAVALLLTGVVAAAGGYLQFRHVDEAIRTNRPVGRGPAAHTLSLALLLCLLLAALVVVRGG